jgi:hypothetical protein
LGATIYDYDVTPANNVVIDGISLAENVTRPPAVNNMFRADGSILARFVDDLGAVNTVGGTGDAITVTLASGITAYATGQMFRFVAGAANTGAVTINVNSIGVKKVRKISGGTDVALTSGDIVAGETYLLNYRSTADSGVGAWVLVGSSGSYLPLTGGTLTGALTVKRGTNPDSTGQPTGTFAETVYAATNASGENGLFVKVNWAGAGATVLEAGYDLVGGYYTSLLSLTGDGSFSVPVAPTLLYGMFTKNATGGNKGADTINASNYYQNGAQLFPCRAWVNFNGTGTVAIRASGNVSSITDNGTGDYTVNFTTAMPDTNYAPVVSAGIGGPGAQFNSIYLNSNSGGSETAPTTSAMRFTLAEVNVAYRDEKYINVAVFR